ALLHAGKGAVGADRDRTQIVVVPDAAHHEILAFGCGLRGRRGLAAELVRPLLRLGRGAVVDGDLMAPFFHEVSGHGEAHHAETEESDFSHVWYLVRSLGFTVLAGRGAPGSAIAADRAHHKRLRPEGNGFVRRPPVLGWRTSRTSKQGS